jgi:transcriptional regulator with XRE-family HTH domain
MTQVYFECTDKSTLNVPVAQVFLYPPGMSIGKRLKELRTGAQLTQDALGELFRSEEKPEGLSKQAVAAWESDRNQLTSDQIILLCKHFRVSPDYLLLGKTDDEAELLTDYRGASERAKIAIRMAAKTSERGK